MTLRDRISSGLNATYNFLNQLIDGVKKRDDLDIRGSQRSVASFGVYRNDYDIELKEIPIREPRLAKQLMDLELNSYIVQHTLWQASRDTFASGDGDEQGFKICNTLKDDETPVDPDIMAIGTELLNRQNGDEYIIGGEFLKRGLENGLMYGDAFIEMAITREGMSRKNDYCVSDSLYLPTWEMFVVSNPHGKIGQYEQRRSLMDKDPELSFMPFKIIHMCYHRYRKYGRSLWKGNESLTTWKNLKAATEALARGAIELGYNPTVHQSATFSNVQQRQEYINNHEQRKAQGIISDLYISDNSKITKLGNVNPNLEPLAQNVLHQRYGLIPAGYPTYYYPGLTQFSSRAKEISNQPATNYSRIRYDNCAFVAKAAKKAINTELVLRLGYEKYLEKMKVGGYRLEFPSWRITPTEEQTAEDKDNDDNNNNNSSEQNQNSRLLRAVI